MFLKRGERTGLTFSLKLGILYAVFFVVSSVGLFVAAYYFMDRFIQVKDRETIHARIQEYRAWLEEGGLSALSARFSQQSALTRGLFFVRLLGARNDVLFVSLPEGTHGVLPEGIPSVPPIMRDLWLSIKDRTGASTWTIGSVPLRGGLILQVGKNSTQSQELISYFRSVFVRFVVPVIFIGLAVGVGLTFRAMKPIRNLIGTVRNILKTGKTNVRVPVRAERGELDELVRLFNLMLDKNEALIQGLHQSLDHVAHDLKTPMTRLRGIAELALQKGRKPSDCEEALADCMEESERVLTMLNTLMDVAEAEAGAMRLDKTEVSIPELMHTVMDLYEGVAEEKGIRVTQEFPSDLKVSGDQTRLRQVFSNLLDNALKYSGEKTQVIISGRKELDHVLLSISDQGPGIPDHELPKIWDRLYRGDQSRSKRGLGLGLSLVKAIVQAHGGTLRVETRLGMGSTFIVSLPGSLIC